MALQQGQCLGQQAAAVAEEQPGLLGCWGDGEGPQLGHGTGRLDHQGLPSSAPARGRGAFVRGFGDLLLSSQNSSGFSTLQVPAKRVGDIKETCGPTSGGAGPARRRLPRCGSLGDRTAVSQESEGGSTALSQAAPHGNWSKPYEMG